MSDDKKKKNEGEFDIFVAQTVYPQAEAIFATHFRMLREIKDDCLVVLDTNALLVPYATGKDSLLQIRDTYTQLTQAKRLIIPGQVCREFAKNRASKLAELYQQLNRKASNITSMQKGRYPLLESLEAYQKAVRLEERIDKVISDYKRVVQNILTEIREWTWNDPVSLLYADLFSTEVVLDLQIDKEETAAELARRQLHNIPPGYKDSGKEDRGIGDFLIWLTILEAGKTRKKSLLFVSGEEKSDWFHKSEGRTLYPRYELVDEYRRSSEGQSFHMVSFSQFLNMYGASESTVEEVREEETRLRIELSLAGEFVKKWAEFEQALCDKCDEVSPNAVPPNRVGAYRMIKTLAARGVVPEHYVHEALEIILLRNGLVHGHIDFPPDVARGAISRLDDLMDEL